MESPYERVSPNVLRRVRVTEPAPPVEEPEPTPTRDGPEAKPTKQRERKPLGRRNARKR